MPYKINGDTLPLLPARPRWIIPNSVGDATSGLPLYPDVAEFEMLFPLMTPDEASFLYQKFAYCQASGTITCELPQLYDPTFPVPVQGETGHAFREYSGVAMELHTQGEFFEEYIQNVKVVLRNVRYR